MARMGTETRVETAEIMTVESIETEDVKTKKGDTFTKTLIVGKNGRKISLRNPENLTGVKGPEDLVGNTYKFYYNSKHISGSVYEHYVNPADIDDCLD